jgi:hypothetical protein
MRKFETAEQIVDFITPEDLAEALDVQLKVVAAARRKGKLPSLWYDAAENLAGRPLPRHLFTFKGRPE